MTMLTRPDTGITSQFSTLPQEIIDMIIALAKGDLPTLAACARVASSWVHISRKHLYYKMEVRAFAAPEDFMHDSFHPFLEDLASRSTEVRSYYVQLFLLPAHRSQGMAAELTSGMIYKILSLLLRLSVLSISLAVLDPLEHWNYPIPPSLRQRFTLERLELLRVSSLDGASSYTMSGVPTILLRIAEVLSLFGSIRNLVVEDILLGFHDQTSADALEALDDLLAQITNVRNIAVTQIHIDALGEQQSTVQLIHLLRLMLDVKRIESLVILSGYPSVDFGYLAKILPEMTNLRIFKSDIRSVACGRGDSPDGMLLKLHLLGCFS